MKKYWVEFKNTVTRLIIQITIVYRAVIFMFYLLNHPLNRNHKFRTFMTIPWWMVNKFFIHIPCIISLTSNIKCICYPQKSLYGALVLYTKLPEYGEMMMLLRVLKEDDIFIDVGANIGVYSLLAASKINRGRIFAFEPSMHSLPRLYENISINNLTNIIQVSESIVSDRVGFEYFEINNMPDYNHMSYLNKNKGAIKIPSVTLDHFIAEKRLSRIKAIKIDVEGVELLVLRGLQKSLAARKVDILIVEITEWASERFGYSKEQVYKYLEDYGFKLYYFDRKYTLKQFNGSLDGAMNIIAIDGSRNWKELGII